MSYDVTIRTVGFDVVIGDKTLNMPSGIYRIVNGEMVLIEQGVPPTFTKELATLRAENSRLRAVADAAREMKREATSIRGGFSKAWDKFCAALAALDEGGEG